MNTVRDASRRFFLQGLAAAGISLPVLPGLARAAEAGARAVPGARPRHLVLVELQGGNDGMNTLVPYASPEYRALRPKLALGRDAVAALDERVGLHPGLSPLMRLWERGHVAVVEGVGYPAPSRSHFRSMEIWETASDSDETRLDGWLAPVVRALPARDDDGIKAVALADDEGPLAGTTGASIVLDDLDGFIAQAKRLAERDVRTDNPTLAHVLEVERTTRRAAVEFSRRLEASLETGGGGGAGDSPDDMGAAMSGGSMDGKPPKRRGPQLPRQLDAIARLIAEEVGPQVWKVGLGSFDTHVSQIGRHAALMKQLADALTGFERALVRSGRWNDVTLVTYSEFGRRAAENASGGTDHGTAAPHFVIGGAVKGGLHGAPPDLARLDAGDVRFTTDFRRIYRTLATDWFGQGLGDAPYAGHERLHLFG